MHRTSENLNLMAIYSVVASFIAKKKDGVNLEVITYIRQDRKA